MIPNRVFARFATEPEQVGFTLNSDTPLWADPAGSAGWANGDRGAPGPLICVAFDLNQRWVADMGVPGPDAGNGGRHLLLPPDWDGQVPDGYYVARSTTCRVLAGVRSLPVGGDVQAANDRIPTLKVHPLDPPADWTEPTWLDLSGQPQDTTPVGWETTLEYWRALHEVIDTEPHLDSFGPLYGELAALGIAKGRPFAPDERMTRILEQAARLANGQLRVQSFADRRRDRVVWPGRQWQWAALRFENGDFYAADHLDVDAREKWFFQAIGASPAMFRRAAPGLVTIAEPAGLIAGGADLEHGQRSTERDPAPAQPGQLTKRRPVPSRVDR